MHALNTPIRKYHLATEDGGIAWDKFYQLVFTKSGKMSVRVVKEFEQAFKSPDVIEVTQEQFSDFTVNGRLLADLVAAKLEEVLASE